MALYTSLYYIRLDLSKSDHELDQSGQGEYSDWTDFSYDTNFRYFNWGHTFTGATYHQIARSNDLGFWAGFAMNQLGSALWEYGVEYREVFSIGDQILTGFGGSTLGEAMFQIAPLLRTKHNWRWAAFFLDPFSLINRPKKRLNRSSLHGFFHWQMGLSNRTSQNISHNTLSLGFTSERNRINQLSRKNIIALSQLQASLDITEARHYDFTTRATLIFNGLYKTASFNRQKLALLGLATGLEYESRDYTTPSDWFGIINLLGMAAYYENKINPWKHRLQAEVYYDFAMIHALALDKLEDEIDLDGIRVVTETLGYYYALGYTVRAMFSLSRRNTSLSYAMAWHSYDSIDKYNRFEQEQTKFFNYQDSLLRQSIILKQKFRQFDLGIRFSAITRKGNIKDSKSAFKVSESVTENQSEIFLQYRL